MKLQRIIKPIALGIAIPIVPLFLWISYSRVTNHLDERKYVRLLSNISGVKSVPFYLNYEDKRMAELILENGGSLHISRFEEGKGDAKNISLSVIGDKQLFCSSDTNRSDFSLDGIDIANYLKKSDLDIKIRNIGDLVENYQAVYLYLAKTMPHDSKHSTVIDDGHGPLWCSIVKYPTNPWSQLKETPGVNPKDETLRNLDPSNALPPTYNRNR